MHERIKEHNRDIRLARTQNSAVSEHANDTGHLPIWNVRSHLLTETLIGTSVRLKRPHKRGHKTPSKQHQQGWWNRNSSSKDAYDQETQQLIDSAADRWGNRLQNSQTNARDLSTKGLERVWKRRVGLGRKNDCFAVYWGNNIYSNLFDMSAFGTTSLNKLFRPTRLSLFRCAISPSPSPAHLKDFDSNSILVYSICFFVYLFISHVFVRTILA